MQDNNFTKRAHKPTLNRDGGRYNLPAIWNRLIWSQVTWPVKSHQQWSRLQLEPKALSRTSSCLVSKIHNLWFFVEYYSYSGYKADQTQVCCVFVWCLPYYAILWPFWCMFRFRVTPLKNYFMLLLLMKRLLSINFALLCYKNLRWVLRVLLSLNTWI